MTRAMAQKSERVVCETCCGEGTVIEFRRFPGEYQAGEPVEVECHECGGAGSWDGEDEETISNLTSNDLRAMYREDTVRRWGNTPYARFFGITDEELALTTCVGDPLLKRAAA